VEVATGSSSLALNGGPAIRSTPLPPRMMIGTGEAQAAATLMDRLLREGGSFDRYDGPEVDLLEADLARYFGVQYVTCVSSGTAAVHAALGALDLDPGTEVIVSSFTDPGAIMPLFFMGLIPVFVDHDVTSTLMAPQSIAAAVTTRTGAILVTHLHGFVCDMDPIMEIGKAHGVPVIGDASQAHAAQYHGSIAAPFGDIGVVSTMAWKHMTTGGQGGFIATNREDLYWAAKRFADRGKPFNQQATSNTGLGLNYRMTELAAVIGRVQLGKLLGVATRRRALLADLTRALEQTRTVRVVQPSPDTIPTPYTIPFRVDVERLGESNKFLAEAMSAEGFPMVPGNRAALVYNLDFVVHEKSFGHTFYPFNTPVLGHQTNWSRPHNPGVDELARRLVVIHPHEDWTALEVSELVASVLKIEGVLMSGR